MMRMTHTLTPILSFVVLWLVAGCIATLDEPKVTSGAPISALRTVEHWTIEFDQTSRTGQNAASNVRLDNVKPVYPEQAQEYLQKVRSRLQEKHRVNQSENFPDRGYILITVYGFETEFGVAEEELVLHESNSEVQSGHSPERRTTYTKKRSKTMNARVVFLDSQRNMMATMTTREAKKPEKLADVIAMFMRGER